MYVYIVVADIKCIGLWVVKGSEVGYIVASKSSYVWWWV